MFVHELHSSQHTKVQLFKWLDYVDKNKKNKTPRIYTLKNDFLCSVSLFLSCESHSTSVLLYPHEKKQTNKHCLWSSSKFDKRVWILFGEKKERSIFSVNLTAFRGKKVKSIITAAFQYCIKHALEWVSLSTSEIISIISSCFSLKARKQQWSETTANLK